MNSYLLTLTFQAVHLDLKLSSTEYLSYWKILRRVDGLEYLEKEIEFVEDLKKTFDTDGFLEIKIPRSRRVFLLLKSGLLIDAIKHIKEQLGLLHLSTLTGFDNGKHLEILYHFNY